METKPLLYGLIGFFIGGLLVATAATTFNKPSDKANTNNQEVSMSEMTGSLHNKTGDDYDSTFIQYMIEHHQAAIDMAKLSSQSAKHDEIKQLSNDIITAQEKEITQMTQWQKDWNYSSSADQDQMSH
jgi:uncharacterized protein (DUF305 family)